MFRSDRDGVSNLYALRLEDGALRRLTNVLGGAFAPAVDPKGDAVAFADYSSRGYDVHVADLDLAAAVPAPSFLDPYPASPPAPAPVAVPDHPYRPWPGMLPRFWSPYWLSRNREDWLGVATSGTDPLFRHVYGLTVSRGTKSDPDQSRARSLPIQSRSGCGARSGGKSVGARFSGKQPTSTRIPWRPVSA